MPVEDFKGLLGKLKELERESQLDPGGAAYRVSNNVADVVLSLASGRASGGTRRAAYYEDEMDLPPPPQPPSLADLKRQIADAASVSDLRSLRRSFARWSHPDRRGKPDDPYATFQMAAANEAIDKAILALRRRTGGNP